MNLYGRDGGSLPTSTRDQIPGASNDFHSRATRFVCVYLRRPVGTRPFKMYGLFGRLAGRKDLYLCWFVCVCRWQSDIDEVCSCI